VALVINRLLLRVEEQAISAAMLASTARSPHRAVAPLHHNKRVKAWMQVVFGGDNALAGVRATGWLRGRWTSGDQLAAHQREGSVNMAELPSPSRRENQ
jgi:hypothetical protein